MAKSAGVRVVPVSLGNLHRWSPPFSILPLAPIKHAYIKIHPAIETKDKSIKEIKKLCFEVIEIQILLKKLNNTKISI
jgi:1-acyl-sn-glycerol-3-phosphate acyltransferase